MDYAVGIYFDYDTTNKLNSIIKAVACNGANSFMIDSGITPHLTLSYFYADNINPIVDMFDNAFTSWRVGEVFFASLGIFTPTVLFAAPVFNEYLHKLNVEINELIGSVATHGDAGHYLPNHWVPHTTLAVQLEKTELIKALETAVDIFTAFSGKVEKLFLAECNPYKEIAVWELPLIL